MNPLPVAGDESWFMPQSRIAPMSGNAVQELTVGERRLSAQHITADLESPTNSPIARESIL
jgi:hypothetical protein